MTLNVSKRCLAHAEPHEMVNLGPHPLLSKNSPHIQGSFEVLGARSGLTIATFDFVHEAQAAAMQTQSSAPCVALNILFEGKGQSWLLDGETRSREIPFRPALYCMVAPDGAQGIDAIKPGTRFRGIDIRIAPALWRRLGGPELEQLQQSTHPHQVAENSRVWVGMLPLPPEVASLARNLVSSVQRNGSDVTIEACALDIISATILLVSPESNRRFAHLLHRDRIAVQKVINLIKSDLAHLWTIAELADATGIGAKRLKQQFPRETGLSVYAYLQECRMQAAQSLLAEHGHSVTETALEVGYSSLSHFSALFRRRFGVSPSTMRSGRGGK